MLFFTFEQVIILMLLAQTMQFHSIDGYKWSKHNVKCSVCVVCHHQ